MNCGSLIKGFSFSTTITTTTKLMQMHSVLHCILLIMSWPLSFVYWTKNQGEQRSEQTQQKKCAKFFSVSWGTVCLFATFLKNKWRKLTNRDARKHMPAPEFMSFRRSVRAIFLFLFYCCQLLRVIFYIGTTFWKFLFFVCNNNWSRNKIII